MRLPRVDNTLLASVPCKSYTRLHPVWQILKADVTPDICKIPLLTFISGAMLDAQLRNWNHWNNAVRFSECPAASPNPPGKVKGSQFSEDELLETCDILIFLSILAHNGSNAMKSSFFQSVCLHLGSRRSSVYTAAFSSKAMSTWRKLWVVIFRQNLKRKFRATPIWACKTSKNTPGIAESFNFKPREWPWRLRRPPHLLRSQRPSRTLPAIKIIF